MTDVTVEQINEIATKFFEQETKYLEAKKISGQYHAEMEATKSDLIDILERANLEKFHIPGVANISMLERLKVTTPKTVEEKAQFFGYVNKHYGDDGLWSYASVNHNTLNTFYNEERQKNADNPMWTMDGIQPPTAEKYLRITRNRV